MSLFSKNPNEKNYVGGKKHFVDIIKNSGPSDALIWLNPEEDFNNNSTLIVAESEEALLYKSGVIERVFTGGSYQLDTQNYPFLTRIITSLSGGISEYNCKVYFVRKAISRELLWGTSSPIQVRDPKYKLATSVIANGAYKFIIKDSKMFLLKLVGNNVKIMLQEELFEYIEIELMQHIKSKLANAIVRSEEEILGIQAKLDGFGSLLQEMLAPVFTEYGLELVKFNIATLDIPLNDSNRLRLEEAYSKRAEIEILGEEFGRVTARDILTNISNSSNAGGVAAGISGIGVGVAAGGVIGNMANELFKPISQRENQEKKQEHKGYFGVNRFQVRKDDSEADMNICNKCGSYQKVGGKFCCECGNSLVTIKYCNNCGKEIKNDAKFCMHCGVKQ